jgi:hypothetical protein
MEVPFKIPFPVKRKIAGKSLPDRFGQMQYQYISDIQVKNIA